MKIIVKLLLSIVVLTVLLISKETQEKDPLKEKLTKLQYDVTQNCSTEPPFENEYWDNKEDGVYLDIVSGKPLFCSIHKYDSGTGWPSFYDIINDKLVTLCVCLTVFIAIVLVNARNASKYVSL